MGVLPLEFVNGQTADTLGLTGREVVSISGIAKDLAPGKVLDVEAVSGSEKKHFQVKCRIDSLVEIEYFRHGGILPFVLRDAMKG